MCTQLSPTLCDPMDWAHQTPVSMGFSRQEYCDGLHFLCQGIFLTWEWNSHLLCLLHWQADSLPLHHLGNPRFWLILGKSSSLNFTDREQYLYVCFFVCLFVCLFFNLRQLFWPEHFAGMHTFDYIVLVSHKTAFTDLQFDVHSPDYIEGVSNNTDL